jgi:hypothetical protein
MAQAEVEHLYIQVKLKDGRILEVNNPNTMLLVYQNDTIAEMQKKYEKGKKDKDPDTPMMEVGGVQIIGGKNGLKFSLFTLVRHLLDSLGFMDMVEVFAGAVASKLPDLEAREQLLEHIKAHKDDKETLKN